MTDNDQLNYRWFILGLTVVTAAFVSTISVACLPPLFKEISEDLGLSLVQIGTVWGITNLAGIVISLLGGVLSDRFGVKVLLSVICILTGITGASRGLSYGFFTLSTTVFLHGTVRLIIGISLSKIIGLWFKGRNLGMAMGIFAMGMGLGLMLGQMISATILSPLLGGWRGVMYFYGVLAIAIGILWYLFGREPHETVSTADESIAEPFRQALSRLIRIRALWLLGFTLLLRLGSVMGVTGYVPLYLREQGWAPASADGALALFYGFSMLCVVPLTSLSDRLGVRKAFLVIAQIVTLVCFGLLPLVDGAPVWVLLILSGAFMDCFMAIMVTMVLETEGVGPEDYGTAIGISLTIGQVGSIVSPPLGNSLANLNMGLPFYFWALLSAAALFTLAPIKDSLAKIKDSRLQTSPSN
jgi:NNP family nitrate/nitrite transporter-like MFS transporter